MNDNVFPEEEPEELDIEEVKMYSPEVLKDALENLSAVYCDRKIRVEFGDSNTIVPTDDEPVIQVNPTTPMKLGVTDLQNQIRILSDTINHEVEHYKSTPLESKKEFVDKWGDWGEVAGQVINIIEDRYIDMKRIREYPGIRRTYAYTTKRFVEKTPAIHEIDDPRGRAVLALSQYTALGGSVPEIEEVNSEDTEVIRTITSLVKNVEYEHKFEERQRIADRCMKVIAETYERPESLDLEDILPEELKELLQEIISTSFEEVDGDFDLDDIDLDQLEDVDLKPKGTDGSEIKSDAKIDGDTELSKPTKSEKKRAEDIVESVNDSSNLRERMHERDERIEEYREHLMDPEKSEVIKSEAESGVVSDVEKSIEKLLSKEKDINTRVGQSLDLRKTVRRASGDLSQNRLYRKRQVLDTGNQVIGVATDISGSMNGDIRKCKMAIGAVARATEMCDDTFVATGFTDNPDRHGEVPEAFDLRLITGPDESFEWRQLDSFSAEDNEPTAAAILDLWDLMEDRTAENHIMFVITDGAAMIGLDGEEYVAGGEKPVKDIQKSIKNVEPECEVIGIGLGHDVDEDFLKRSFGKNSYIRTNINDLGEDIVQILLRNVKTKRV